MPNTPAPAPKKKGSSCLVIGLIILAIFILLAAFIGSFAFSFVKSRVANLVSGNLTPTQKLEALQNLTGGKLGALPSSIESGGSGTTTTGSTKVQDDQELKECKKGTYYQTGQGKVAVTGKEKITLDGTQYEMCCWEATSNQFAQEDLQAMKNCIIIDQPDSVVMYNKENNVYKIIGAFLNINGKQCSFVFDENGNQTSKDCQ